MRNGFPAKAEFRFCTRLDLMELSGRWARNLRELLEHLREVDGSAIFNHTHNFLKRMGFMEERPTSDFAVWTQKILLEPRLAERLAGVDPMDLPSIRELRLRLIAVIEARLEAGGEGRTVAPGEEFYFLHAVSFVFPTDIVVTNLYEFAEALKRITVASLVYHFFDSRIRLESGRSDFAVWLEECVQCPDLARKFDRLDVHASTLENLRGQMVGLVEKKLFGKIRGGH